jgi:hypothetical protein
MSPASRVALIVTLGVLSLALGAELVGRYQPYSFLHGDGTFYANIARSLARGGGYRQEAFTARSWYFEDLGWNHDLDQGWSNVALGSRGGLYPKHSVLFPTLAFPLYGLFGYDGLLLFTLGMVLLGAALTMRLLDRARTPPPVAAAVVLALYLSPEIRHHAYSVSNDFFAAAVFLLGVWLAARSRWAWAGLAWGLAVFAKPLHVALVLIVALPVAVSLARGRRWRALAAGAGGFSVPILLFMVMNACWFGGPFTTSYDRVVTRQAGEVVLASARAAFSVPWSEGLGRALLDGRVGFVPGFPALALVPLGWIALAARRRVVPLAQSVAALGLAAAVFGRYVYPSGRFLFPFLLFAALPLAALGEELMRLGGRAGVWWRARRAQAGGGRRTVRWRAGIVALVVAIVLGGVGIARGLVTRPPQCVGGVAVDRLAVRTEQGTPCDFFNLRHQRWECSHLDEGPGDMVGAAWGGECRLGARGGREGEWLRVPLRPRWRGKRVVWPEPGRYRVRAALDPRSPVGARGALVLPGAEGERVFELTSGEIIEQIVDVATGSHGPEIGVRRVGGSAGAVCVSVTRL